MDNYIEILDSLITTNKAKKSTDPSNQNKKIFFDAWVALAVESKFNDSAEQFLYEGFVFCGAAPFYSYLRQSEDKEATLNALFNGKFYGKDNDKTFRLLTHLLALMLNDNFPPEMLSDVIRRFVAVSKTKEKKTLVNLKKIIRKYFLNELSPDTNLCPLSSIEANSAPIKEFVIIISSAMTSFEQSTDSTKGKFAKNIEKVREWFAAYANTLKSSSKPEDNTETADATENNNGAESEDKLSEPKHEDKLSEPNPEDKLPEPKLEDKLSEPNPEDKLSEPKHEDTMSRFVELVAKLNRTAAVIQVECNLQKERIKTLEADLATEKNRLSDARKEISGQQLFIAKLKEKFSAAENEISALKEDVVRQENLIAEKDAEIAARIKMADVLSRDKTKQADELLQRLTAEVKIEYRDFMEAQGIPMSCDLGENLRDQLQHVFDILEKGGMKINGD